VPLSFALMDIYSFFVFIIGLELGSFANVCIFRWPRNQSILHPVRSQCPWCKHQIHWFDNIPVLSFIFLEGKCRNCKGRISWRYPIIEFVTALLGVFTFKILLLHPGVIHPVYFLSSFGFVFFLVVTTLTDLEWKIIPDMASYSLIVIGILKIPFDPFFNSGNLWASFLDSFLGLTFGGGVLWALSYIGLILFKKESMGGGDIKLLAGIGAFLGFKGAVFVILIASIIGGVFSVLGLLFRFLRQKQYIPFGPFLNIAALIIFLMKVFNPHYSQFWFFPF